MHHYFLCCEPFLVKIATFHGRHLWHGFGKVSWSQTFPWNHSWLHKNRFHEKEGHSYMQMVFIVCCLLLTAPNKGKIISVSQVTNGVFWVCITILWLVHNRKKKKKIISFIYNHISPYFECLFDDKRVDMKYITVISSGVADVVS